MQTFDEQWSALMQRILREGDKQNDRTGVGTYNIPAAQMQFDLREGLPILAVKSVSFKNVLTELLWFIKGQTNIQPLLEENNHIWTEWPFENWLNEQRISGKQVPERYSDEYKGLMKSFEKMVLMDDEFARKWGDLGPVYGFQWRAYGGDYKHHNGIKGVHKHFFYEDGDMRNYRNTNGVDQLWDMIENAKKNPGSRRLLVDAWQADILKEQALPPCHPMYELTVTDEYVDLSFVMRSNDAFLGNPYNVTSYAIMLKMIARELGKEARYLTYTGHNVHLYSNHVAQAQEVAERLERLNELRKQGMYGPVDLIITADKDKNFFELTKEDFELVNYNHMGKISAEVAI